MLGERIKERKEIRAQIAGRDHNETVLLLISESIDDYLEHRIQSDKVVEGILKDIKGDISRCEDCIAEKIPGTRT